MTGKQLTLLVIILVLLALVIGAVVYVRFQAEEDPFAENGDTTTQDDLDDLNGTQQDDTTDDTALPTERVTVVHAYSNGTHSYSGSIVAPTPCHQLSADALIAESSPEQITIQLTLQEPEPGTVCTQVTDRKSFDLSIPASAQARLVRVTLNGSPLPFEIFEESKG